MQPLDGRRARPSGRASRRASSPGPETNASRSRQSGQSSSRCSGGSTPLAARDAQVLLQPVAGGASSARSMLAEDEVVLRAGAVDVHDVGERARGGRGSRSMLMIGVIPLPALMKSEASGSGSGRHERALDVAEPHDRARLARGGRRTARRSARVHELDRDRDAAVRVVGVRGQRVGAPVMAAVDLDADPQVLAGEVARPGEPRPDDDRDASGVSCWMRSIAPAQLARRPQRVDQLDVVVRQERREQRAHGAQRAATGGGDLRGGAELGHAGGP